MKPELLDSLLLDRSLGELTPAVSALLDAHLARDSAGARRAAGFDATLHLARAAVAVPREIPRQPLDLDRLRRELRASRPVVWHPEFLRLAACLALGLTGGWLFHAARINEIPPKAAALVTARATDPASRFWSVNHFAQDAAAISWERKR